MAAKPELASAEPLHKTTDIPIGFAFGIARKQRQAGNWVGSLKTDDGKDEQIIGLVRYLEEFRVPLADQ